MAVSTDPFKFFRHNIFVAYDSMSGKTGFVQPFHHAVFSSVYPAQLFQPAVKQLLLTLVCCKLSKIQQELKRLIIIYRSFSGNKCVDFRPELVFPTGNTFQVFFPLGSILFFQKSLFPGTLLPLSFQTLFGAGIHLLQQLPGSTSFFSCRNGVVSVTEP